MRPAPLVADHPHSFSASVGDTMHLLDTAIQIQRPLPRGPLQWFSVTHSSRLLLDGLTELQDIFDIEGKLGSYHDDEAKQNTLPSRTSSSAWQSKSTHLASHPPKVNVRPGAVSPLVAKPFISMSRWSLSDSGIIMGLLLNCLTWCTILGFAVRQGEYLKHFSCNASSTARIIWPDNALRPPDCHV